MTSFNAVKKTGQLLVLLLSLVAIPAFATDMAATVLFSHGTVTVTNAAGGHDLKKGDGVAAGDTIHTGDNGRIQMRFSDGGLVSLRPNSAFAVDKYNQPTSDSEGSLAFNLIKGGLRTLSGSIGHKDHANYQLKTSVATLGIRGTQFMVTMDGKTMRVHVGHGQISLFNEFGQLLVSAGQNGQVTFGNAPELSLIVPDFGGKGDDKSGDQGNGDSSNLAPPDTSLTQTLPPSFMLGEDTELLFKGVAVSWALYDYSVSYPWTTNPTPSSLSVPAAYLESALGNAGIDGSGGIPDVGHLTEIAEDAPGTNVTGGLVWGVPNVAAGEPYFAYVLGRPTTNLPLTATLSYSLDTSGTGGEGGYIRNTNTGAVDPLTAFDMTVTLNGLADPEFQVTKMTGGIAGSTGNGFYMDSSVTGSWTSTNGDHSSFEFTGATAGANSSCGGCNLDVAGIFSGNEGEQAGVTFRIDDSDHVSTSVGAAVLTQNAPSVGF